MIYNVLTGFYNQNPEISLYLIYLQTMQSISFFFTTLTQTIVWCLLLGSAQTKTLESDIDVLRAIKLAIDPVSITEYSFLNTWNFDIDPCESTSGDFLGILCTIPQDNSSSQITAIDLEGDEYDGFLTPAIENLTELTTLNLRRNQFRGPIPSSISRLAKLTSVILSSNFFSGSIPSDIDMLNKLEVLDLSRNMLSGTIPASISGLQRLRQLSLANNEFIGTIPPLSGLWQLNTLDLSTNQLLGEIQDLPGNIKTLLLNHNLLSGNISSSLKRIETLETLDLSDNRLSGAIYPEILTLPYLKHVNVSLNRFTSVEVYKFADNESQLQVLDMHGNRLQGHLPVNLFTYANLTALNLGHNVFSGRIPQVYGERLEVQWKSLFLNYNFLEGNLPPEFAHAHKIRGSLAHNCLNCPQRVELCHGGQRHSSECAKRNNGGATIN